MSRTVTLLAAAVTGMLAAGAVHASVRVLCGRLGRAGLPQLLLLYSSTPNLLTKASRKKQNKSYSSYIVRSAFLNTCRESKEGLRVLGIFLIMTKH